MRNMDEFTEAYIESAIWASVDDKGDPLDQTYDQTDLSLETRAKMQEDCKDFQERFAEILSEAYQNADFSPDKAAHDFFLTRNWHGAGFWDRGLGSIGDKLTEAAHSFGTFDLYVGDDHRIYGG